MLTKDTRVESLLIPGELGTVASISEGSIRVRWDDDTYCTVSPSEVRALVEPCRHCGKDVEADPRRPGSFRHVAHGFIYCAGDKQADPVPVDALGDRVPASGECRFCGLELTDPNPCPAQGLDGAAHR